MPTFSAIAFDLDNTLIDRDAAFRCLMVSWLQRNGQQAPELLNEILCLDGHGHGSRKELFQFLAVNQLFSETSVQLWDRFRREFPACFKTDPALISSLNEVRKQGTPIAVLTNGGSDLQRGKLRHAGLDQIFRDPMILISEEIGVSKPSKAAFQRLIDRLQVAAGEILYVGDHPIIDIEAAAACGLQTCLVTNPLTGLQAICNATT